MIETITFGGGCFWCLDALFRKVAGVQGIISGYAGGTASNPDYASVCSGTTGHAEVVQISFDSSVISLQHILELFFDAHDPTTPDQQGADRGTQYRSIILYTSAEQKQVIDAVIGGIAAQFPAPITTQIVPLQKFYPAEDYHQNYYAKNPDQPYCLIVIAPKLQKFLSKTSK